MRDRIAEREKKRKEKLKKQAYYTWLISQDGGQHMQEIQIIQHADKREDGVFKAGNTYILQPKVNYTGQGIRWFDDSKLIKKHK